ncbi:MAG: type IV toxin-antitoxin system AbiEi family antitoxin [Proteobacteria bacterium]|nr:type IV toxin-antitoxin system AbiEi family antitoxin [Pseudomonadota bacterium]MBU4583042.1 type IV toxin-antitoxin system AbiEi family antitoxin [Pseudomonadota bacterium]MCG2742026.1 type IV toxin-antitoxin system AbiEi family antitoxin [Syntrophaceae bacterium]
MLIKSMTAFIEALQAKGRYTFTLIEAMDADQRSDIALEAALRRLKQKGRIANPRRGFYVIVPVEYREAGCPPANWFIDALMRFLGQPYYVGILSAAAIHGAAHQQPMLFQVITDRPTRPARAGRVRIRFHVGRHVEKAPVVEIQTETGSMRVSTPEATAFDLVRFAPSAGHIGNVMTVLHELVEKIDPQALTSLADLYAVSDVQRLGYLLERLGEDRLAEPLAFRLKARRYRPILLAPGQAKGDAPSDPRWRVIPNETVEVEF